MDSVEPTDLQGLFEARAGRGDFLTAEKVDDVIGLCNTPEIGSPTGRWIGQMFRTLSLVQQQAENSRKRILLGLHNLCQRKVAYWSIDAPIASYGLADALPMAQDSAVTAANMRTRLNPFSPSEINLLLRVGYAGADASLRKQGLTSNTPIASFNGLPFLG